MDAKGPEEKTSVVSTRTKQLLAYLLLAAALIFGMWRIESRVEDAERAAKRAETAAERTDDALARLERAIEIELRRQCVSGNAARTAIRGAFDDLISLAVRDQQPREGETEAEFFERQQRTARFLQDFNLALEQRLPIRDCNADGQPG